MAANASRSGGGEVRPMRGMVMDEVIFMIRKRSKRRACVDGALGVSQSVFKMAKS